jgi:hypothetical protein
MLLNDQPKAKTKVGGLSLLRNIKRSNHCSYFRTAIEYKKEENISND